MKSVIRVGNGAGFWGDNLDAPRLLCESSDIDYLTLEYLAELTLSILAHLKSRNPNAGYVTDFPVVMQSIIPALKARNQLRIVTNAGGMNPEACAREIARLLCAANLNEIPIAAVSGDDIHSQLPELLNRGESFLNFDTQQPLGETRHLIESANVYLGAAGIVQALKDEARIVITGRVADASLTVGPAMYEFGWEWNDYHRLAAASVAGHLIECGAQVTGGMYSAASANQSFVNIGYPIAEISHQGNVVITKPDATDGMVTPATVAEQLIYEIGDPRHYLTPDVDVDFSSVVLNQIGTNRVEVMGASGTVPPETYKVSMAYRNGYMAQGTLVIFGPDAPSKAMNCGRMILSRVRRAGFDLERSNIECLGAGGVLPGVVLDSMQGQQESSEVVLRVSVQDSRREAVERFVREFSPCVTSGPPGVTGYTGPRTKPWPVLAYWPTTIQRHRVAPVVKVQKAGEWAAS